MTNYAVRSSCILVCRVALYPSMSVNCGPKGNWLKTVRMLADSHGINTCVVQQGKDQQRGRSKPPSKSLMPTMYQPVDKKSLYDGRVVMLLLYYTRATGFCHCSDFIKSMQLTGFTGILNCFYFNFYIKQKVSLSVIYL